MAYDAYEHVAVEVDEGVATVEFRRPEVYNALNTQTVLDLQRAASEIGLDRSVDVVVFGGQGDDAFSAGADIEEYAGPAEDHDPRQKDRQDLFYETFERVYDLHAPTIAKIDGYCVGGGLVLATFCDLRIADESAEFGVPTTDIGQTPGGGATDRMIRLVGEAKAKELVFTSGLIDAAEAHRIGLVNRVVPEAALDDEVDEIVEAIQDTGREAVKNSKRALNHAATASDPETAREFEAEVWWEQFETDERERLVDRFLED